MNKHAKPFMIVAAFWFALFFFVLAGYSGSFGSITGFAVSNAQEAAFPLGLQSIIILVLFFTNLVTIFFLVREMGEK